MLRIVHIGRDGHLIRWELHEEGLQSRVSHRWEAMLIHHDVEIITSLRLALMDQDANVIDTTQSLGLFKVATTLDGVKELIVRHGLHNPCSFCGKLVGRDEKYSMLIVQ